MCLEAIVSIHGKDRDELEVLAERITAAGPLKIVLARRGLLRRFYELRLSEPGRGCACSMLSDDAAPDASCWAMRSESAAGLARALEQVGQSVVGSWTFEASWDPATQEKQVSRAELVALARDGRIGNSVKYVVAPHA